MRSLPDLGVNCTTARADPGSASLIDAEQRFLWVDVGFSAIRKNQSPGTKPVGTTEKP